MPVSSWHEGLDEAQREAASTRGHTVVVAGPGAGKTRTLLARVLFLLEEGVPPGEILLLTFTVKTAGELRRRLGALGAEGVAVDTFHGLAYELCRRRGLSPRLAEPEELEALFRDVLRSLGRPVRGAAARLEALLAGRIADEELLGTYDRALRAHGLWDFRRLLQEASRGDHGGRLRLLVDEFQDLNPELVSFLRSFPGAEFFLVGDPAQAIYGFRGASPEVVHDFLQGLPSLSVRFLPWSWRVPERILSFAEGLRAPGPLPQVRLRARRGGGRLEGRWFPSPAAEARGVATLVGELLGGLQMETSGRGLAPGEVAVVARVRQVLEAVGEALARAGIPCRPASREREQALAAIEAVAARAREGGLGAVRNMVAAGEVDGRVSREVETVLGLSRDAEELLFRLETLRAGLSLEHDAASVPLLTIHETKGLEFRAVVLAGAEEGLLPFTLLPDADPEEEKRLTYVALTRASESFYFTGARGRVLFGRRLPGRVSPHLAPLPRREEGRGRSARRQRSLF